MSAQRWFMEIEPGWEGATGRRRTTYHMFRDRIIDGCPTRISLAMPEPLFSESEAIAVMHALNLADGAVT